MDPRRDVRTGPRGLPRKGQASLDGGRTMIMHGCLGSRGVSRHFWERDEPSLMAISHSFLSV